MIEPKAGAVTTPKPAVPAKGAAQKKQESSSEESSSDSEDEEPAKVCQRICPHLRIITCFCSSSFQMVIILGRCVQQILTAYFTCPDRLQSNPPQSRLLQLLLNRAAKTLHLKMRLHPAKNPKQVCFHTFFICFNHCCSMVRAQQCLITKEKMCDRRNSSQGEV